MYHPKSILVLILYISFCGALILKSLKDRTLVKDNSKKEQIKKIAHQFKDVTYFQLEGAQKKASLNSTFLEAGDDNIHADNPYGYIFDSSGSKVDFKADEANYLKKLSLIKLTKNVEMKNSQAKVNCEQAQLDTKRQFAKCRTNVKTQINQLENGDKIFISSRELRMWLKSKLLRFSGDVKGRLKREYSYEPGITFSSNKLKVFSDDLRAELEESVRFDFEGVKSRSGRAEIFLDNYNKKLKYYVLYDDIEIEQKIQSQQGETFTRRAYSEVVEAFNLERKIVLKGAPKVSQGKDITRGYKITLFLDREIMEVDNSSSIIKIQQ